MCVTADSSDGGCKNQGTEEVQSESNSVHLRASWGELQLTSLYKCMMIYLRCTPNLFNCSYASFLSAFVTGVVETENKIL